MCSYNSRAEVLDLIPIPIILDNSNKNISINQYYKMADICRYLPITLITVAQSLVHLTLKTRVWGNCVEKYWLSIIT